MANVIEEIAAERKRQIEIEGWTAGHDDEHSSGEMARASAVYVLHGVENLHGAFTILRWGNVLYHLWPWSREWWKPSTNRRNLIKAAALIVAEIERIDRAS